MLFTLKQAERDSRDVEISNRPTTKREYYILYEHYIVHSRSTCIGSLPELLCKT